MHLRRIELLTSSLLNLRSTTELQMHIAESGVRTHECSHTAVLKTAPLNHSGIPAYLSPTGIEPVTFRSSV